MLLYHCSPRMVSPLTFSFCFVLVACAQAGLELCYVAKDNFELLIFLPLPLSTGITGTPGICFMHARGAFYQLSYMPSSPWTFQGLFSHSMSIYKM